MKDKKKLSCCIQLAIPLLCILAPILIYVHYAYFNVTLRELIPQYDAENMAVFSEIPPPEGVTEKETYSIGIDNGYQTYGRVLNVVYKYDLEHTSREAIASYYEQLLLSSGWDEYNRFESYFRFVREKTCLSLRFYSNTERPTYKLNIWQDFDSHQVTPLLPIGFNIFDRFFMAEVMYCP